MPFWGISALRMMDPGRSVALWSPMGIETNLKAAREARPVKAAKLERSGGLGEFAELNYLFGGLPWTRLPRLIRHCDVLRWHDGMANRGNSWSGGSVEAPSQQLLRFLGAGVVGRS
jgi:hypothetical protein